MKLELHREPSTANCTLGSLYVNEKFQCFTLEDVVRPTKVYGMTAIPAGSYRIDVTYSNRFKRMLPLLLYVPNFSGVRIHLGNTAENTEGCILVGLEKGIDRVNRSRDAFNPLYELILDAYNSDEDIWIHIS